MAALPSTGITTTLVGTTLGVATRNVGNLCRAESINKWSKWKPISVAHEEGLTSQLFKDNFYGFNICRLGYKDIEHGVWLYKKPTGSSLSPYRIGDFRNYEHRPYTAFTDAIIVNSPVEVIFPTTIKRNADNIVKVRFFNKAVNSGLVTLQDVFGDAGCLILVVYDSENTAYIIASKAFGDFQIMDNIIETDLIFNSSASSTLDYMLRNGNQVGLNIFALDESVSLSYALEYYTTLKFWSIKCVSETITNRSYTISLTSDSFKYYSSISIIKAPSGQAYFSPNPYKDTISGDMPPNATPDEIGYGNRLLFDARTAPDNGGGTFSDGYLTFECSAFAKGPYSMPISNVTVDAGTVKAATFGNGEPVYIDMSITDDPVDVNWRISGKINSETTKVLLSGTVTI